MDKYTVPEKIKFAKIRLLMRQPLFGAILMSYPIILRDVGTMCTNFKNIYVDPRCGDALPRNQFTTVILHELLHIILKHFYRFHTENKSEEERKMINYAEDYAVNSIIKDELTPDDKMLELPDWVLYDEKFKGLSAEKILEILKKEKKENPQKYQQRVVLAIGGEGKPPGQYDNHDISSQETQKQIEQTKKETGRSFKEQMDDIDYKVFEAAKGLIMGGKSRGTIPSHMQRLIDEYLENLKGHVDWKRYIKGRIQEIGKGQYTMNRVNRSYIPYGFYFPGQCSTKAKIAMAVDTSGSVSTNALIKFIGELKYMLRLIPGLEVVLFGVDAEIQGKARIKGMKNFKDTLIKTLKGGGGTSFIPVFKNLLESRDRDIKALFYFTDGEGDQNQIDSTLKGHGNWETFWVVPLENKEAKFPFGQKIVMWDKDKEIQKRYGDI